MRTHLLLALVAVLFAQSKPERAATVVEPAPITLEVAKFAFDGNRYDGGIGEVVDQDVNITRQVGPDEIEVKVSRRRQQSDTVLTLHLERDASGKTHATAKADWYADMGPPHSGTLEDLRGLVVIANDDWGPGKSLTATFLIVGNNGRRDTTLRGSIHFVNPAAGDKR